MPTPRTRRVRAHNPWGSHGQADLSLIVPAWTRDALCAEIGVEAFFNDDSGGDQATRLARKTCQQCPVRTECLEWALTWEPWEDQHGVFGGMGPKERRELRRERELQQQGVAA